MFLWLQAELQSFYYFSLGTMFLWLQAELQGFYDPCVGEDKELSVTYEFRRAAHSCTFKEQERILLPSEGWYFLFL